MIDLLIKGATVIDGTGAANVTADVAVIGEQIVQIGSITSSAKQTIQANGAWLTPGFIDIHTHYDGQVTWDDTLHPSIDHGVTTVVMGNCGVGFAPVQPNKQQSLIELMEGVEEIPHAALAEGLQWNWEDFASYLQVLNQQPKTINTMNLVPHDCLRLFVMGERAAARELASADDIATMQNLLREALKAGAAGFSTGRTDNHRTARGIETPSADANTEELVALASVLKDLPYRVIHAVSDFDCMRASNLRESFEREYALFESMAQASGRPLALSWLQRINAPEQAQWLGAAAIESNRKGLDIRLQTSSRPIGVLSSLGSTLNPLMAFKSYHAVAHLPLDQRAAALREPGLRQRILSEGPMDLAKAGSSVPPLVDQLLRNFDQTAMLMFALQTRDLKQNSSPDYFPDPRTSFGVQARLKQQPALHLVYDYLSAGDGTNLVYFPIFNYLQGNADSLEAMLAHPHALHALSDAGAHVGSICDASLPTSLLLDWRNKIGLERAIHLLTQRNALHMGLSDRGVIRVGAKADFNLIDPAQLGLSMPYLVNDLPAGGKRFLQGARGYLGTWVNGQQIVQNGHVSAARPGQTLRQVNG